MKILVITDIHSKPNKIYEYLNETTFDHIILTGDVTDFGSENDVIEILNTLSNFAPVYAIGGNCDPKNISSLIDKSNAINIHDTVKNMEYVTLIGFGGSNITPFNTLNEYSDEILYEQLNKYNEELMSDDVTILVTHAPPYNTDTDLIETGDHVGSKGIRKIIEETQPTINLCGHVHESIASCKIDNTLVINPGDAASGHACILEINNDTITTKLLNL